MLEQDEAGDGDEGSEGDNAGKDDDDAEEEGKEKEGFESLGPDGEGEEEGEELQEDDNQPQVSASSMLLAAQLRCLEIWIFASIACCWRLVPHEVWVCSSAVWVSVAWILLSETNKVPVQSLTLGLGYRDALH